MSSNIQHVETWTVTATRREVPVKYWCRQTTLELLAPCTTEEETGGRNRAAILFLRFYGDWNNYRERNWTFCLCGENKKEVHLGHHWNYVRTKTILTFLREQEPTLADQFKCIFWIDMLSMPWQTLLEDHRQMKGAKESWSIHKCFLLLFFPSLIGNVPTILKTASLQRFSQWRTTVMSWGDISVETLWCASTRRILKLEGGRTLCICLHNYIEWFSNF